MPTNMKDGVPYQSDFQHYFYTEAYNLCKVILLAFINTSSSHPPFLRPFSPAPLTFQSHNHTTTQTVQYSTQSTLALEKVWI